MIPSIPQVKKKYRKGLLITRYFRHVFEHKNIKKALGAGLAMFIVGTSFVPQSQVQAQTIEETPVVEVQNTLKTEKGIQYPVENIKVTQGYGFFHPGLDLDGLTGNPIRPIKPGRVASVSYSKFAYGNSIIIDHGNELMSLYAHLSKIEVKEGQEVTMDKVIGQMGASGRAFGDHLHLEIHLNGKAINPLTVLSR